MTAHAFTDARRVFSAAPPLVDAHMRHQDMECAFSRSFGAIRARLAEAAPGNLDIRYFSHVFTSAGTASLHFTIADRRSGDAFSLQMLQGHETAIMRAVAAGSVIDTRMDGQPVPAALSQASALLQSWLRGRVSPNMLLRVFSRGRRASLRHDGD